mgnify:CR=1 FL=1
MNSIIPASKRMLTRGFSAPPRVHCPLPPDARGHRRRFLLLAVLLGGCDPSGCNGGGGLDFTNGVDPASGTPAVLVDTRVASIWTSSWDNPPIQGRLVLDKDHAATRSAPDWSYTRFDLDVDDGSTFPIPWPQQEGTYTSDACATCLGANMFWEAHGLELGPRLSGFALENISTVQAYRTDSDIGAPVPYDNPGLFQLAPAVRLVPLNIVVTFPPNDANFGPNWVPQDGARALLDDVWAADIQTTTNPNEHPHAVNGAWTRRSTCGAETCSAMGVVQPDRVWDQCDIQFRMVSYTSCPVPADVFDNVDQINGCNVDQHASNIEQAINGCAPNNGATTVVFTSFLANHLLGCTNEPLGAAKKTSPFVYITYQGIKNLVLSHELGHRLGLPDIGTSDSCDQDSLMCTYDQQHVRTILGCEDSESPDYCGACITARSHAEYLQGLYNGW